MPANRIVLFAQSWAERSVGPHCRSAPAATGEVVYATRVTRGGLRIPRRRGPGVTTTGLTPLATYPWKQRWEKTGVQMQFPELLRAESLFDQFRLDDGRCTTTPARVHPVRDQAISTHAGHHVLDRLAEGRSADWHLP